jgi:hypothetical protein
MNEVAKTKMTIMWLVSIEWAVMEVRVGSVVKCYDLKYFTLVKRNLNHAYISFQAPSPCKPCFKGEIYLKFVIQ